MTQFSKRGAKSKLSKMIKESYLGKVVSIDDDKFIGRCKIRVFGVFGGEDDTELSNIPAEDLPYAYPMSQLIFGQDGYGSFHTPKMDAIVRVWFDGDHYHPYYWSISDISPALQAKVREDYKNFHGILFDEEEKLRIYYTKNTGLLLNLDDSIFNVKPDNSILIDHKGSTSTIELRGPNMTMTTTGNCDISTTNNVTVNSNMVHVQGATATMIGPNPIYSSTSGEPLIALLMAMATVCDSKIPATSLAVSLVEQFKPLILSQNVTVSP